MSQTDSAFAGDRLAKVIARSGMCSRRDAELWIKDGRVAVNGKVIRTPAFNVTEKDKVKVDGQPLADRQGTRVWLYHKPPGLVVTEKDPEGRPTIFETLEQQGLPRVVSIGRLDINTEGLLLLTNDGGLKRVLELPATGWLRRYRVRAFGSITQPQLDALKEGIQVDGVNYGPIEAELEREQGSNVWLNVGLREGKNREVKNVLGALGLTVNRLIRISFGPFQLGDLPIAGIEVVKAKVLRDQLGKRLADEAGVDFDSEMPEPQAIKLARGAANPALRAAKPGAEPPKQRKAMADRTERFRFVDGRDKPREQRPEDRPMAKDRPGSRFPRKPARPEAAPERRSGPPRKVFNADGSETLFEAKSYGRKPKREEGAEGGKPPFKKDFSDRPKRDFGDKPRGDLGDRPKRPYSGRPAAEGAERPKRSYGDKPRGDFGDRPKRPYSGRPAADGAERPKRSYGDKPRGDFGDRPKRPYSGRPAADGADRPKRSYGDKPKGDFGDRPKRPYSPRPGSDSDRPKRPYGAKPGGAPRGDFGDKPKRPRGSGPGGDRPRRPKPKA
jgi:23S rRNA pseudouridine2605 synthase